MPVTGPQRPSWTTVLVWLQSQEPTISTRQQMKEVQGKATKILKSGRAVLVNCKTYYFTETILAKQT